MTLGAWALPHSSLSLSISITDYGRSLYQRRLMTRTPPAVRVETSPN